MTPVGKATVGMIVSGKSGADGTYYYLDIDVLFHGGNEVTGSANPSQNHAVFVATNYSPIADRILLTYTPDASSILGHNTGFLSRSLSASEYQSIVADSEIVIDEDNDLSKLPANWARLFYGNFHQP